MKHTGKLIRQVLITNLLSGKTDLTTGISGLTKALLSNKTSPEIITNYTKTVFKGRLEVLTDRGVTQEEYEKQRKLIKPIIQMANKYYDLVFVDLSGELKDADVQAVIENTNLLIVNLKQNLIDINEYIQLKEEDGILRKENIMMLVGKCDELSKYNSKNIASYIKEKEIYSIPYNTQFSEATGEGEIVDFFMKYNNAKIYSPHYNFIESVKKLSKNIISKLKDLQRMKY